MDQPRPVQVLVARVTARPGIAPRVSNETIPNDCFAEPG